MTGLVVLGIFGFLAVLMYRGKLPALLALPILAMAVAFIAGIPFYFQETVLEPSLWARTLHALSRSLQISFVTVPLEGIPRLQTAIFTVIMGGIFGHYLKLSGIPESLVRKVAELAGDSPFLLSLSLTLLVALLFTTLNGLGSMILVATIYFPVLLSLGIPSLLVGCLFILGFCLGGLFNLVNWALYLDVLKLSQEDVLRYVLPFGALNLVAVFLFSAIEFRRARIPFSPHLILRAAAVLAVVCVGIAWIWTAEGPRGTGPADGNGWTAAWPVGPAGFKGGVCLALLAIFAGGIRGFYGSYLAAPFVPIGLVLLLRIPINPAFILGILYLFGLMSFRERASWIPSNPTRLLVQSIQEGIQQMAPAVGIMMGIGMVLVSFSQKPVADSLEPFLRAAVPAGPWGYIAVFTLAGPLALYRGPLNLWGMGSGLLAMLQKTGTLSAPATMALFISTGQIQGVCDPTNTHNVWVANQLQLDVQAILKKTLPYMWGLTLAGLMLGSLHV